MSTLSLIALEANATSKHVASDQTGILPIDPADYLKITLRADGRLELLDQNGRVTRLEVTEFIRVEGQYFLTETGLATLCLLPNDIAEPSEAPALGLLIFSGFGISASTGYLISRPPDYPDNTPPSFASPNTVRIPENQFYAYTALAVDAQGDTLSFEIIGGPDAALFELQSGSGTIRFLTAPDFDAPHDQNGDNVYEFLITAFDGQLHASHWVTVEVINLNDTAPLFTSAAQFNVLETETGMLHTVTATDGDGDEVSYAITEGNEAGLFEIDATSGEISLAAGRTLDLDVEAPVTEHTLTIMASDGTFTASQHLTLTVTPVNEFAPVFTTDADVSIAENQTGMFHTVQATDADGDEVTYTITGGNEASLFEIDAQTGEISLAEGASLDLDVDTPVTEYTLTVTASDGNNAPTQDITLTVTPVNEFAPQFESSPTASVAEDIDTDTVIHIVQATDGDNDLLTYALRGPDADLFVIDAQTGAISLAEGASLDFEDPSDADSNNVYQIIVSASDGDNATTQTLTLTVTNVNDNAPVFEREEVALTLPEHTTSYAFYQPVVNDADGDDLSTFSFSISGGADAAAFTIDAMTGALSFAQPPDFETPHDVSPTEESLFLVEIEVSDLIFTDNQSLSIEVLDFSNEPADIIVPEQIQSGEIAGLSILGPSSYSNSGMAVSILGDINGDGLADMAIGAPYANGWNGEAFILLGGRDTSDSPEIDLSDLDTFDGFRIDPEPGDTRTGHSVSAAGDINGDGLDDFLVGDIGAGSGGVVYVIYGSPELNHFERLDLANLSSELGFKIHAHSQWDVLGSSVDSAGDVNGDGYDDLILGAYNASTGGVAYVIYGGTHSFTDNTLRLADLTSDQGFAIAGAEDGDQLGKSVSAAGDVNGDGFADLIVGAPHANSARGEAFVIYGGNHQGPVNTSTLTSEQGFRLFTDTENAWLGRSVSSAGDVNGDGFDDLLVGAPGTEGSFHHTPFNSYIIYGGTALADLNLSDSLSSEHGRVISESYIQRDSETFYHTRLGYSVSAAGDINGDGFDDVILGAKNGLFASPAFRGEAYILYGGPSDEDNPDLELAHLTRAEGFILTATVQFAHLGWSVSGSEDVNGDGFDDVIIGAPYHYNFDGTGETYIIYGGQTGLESFVGQSFTGTENLTGPDQFHGQAGDDVFANIGAGDVVRGGPGDDRVELTDFGFADIEGGTGLDTLALSGQNLTLDLTADRTQAASLDSFEVIDLGGANNAVIIDELAVFNLTGIEATQNGITTLTLLGDRSNTLHLNSELWDYVGSEPGYEIYRSGRAEVRVATAIAIESVMNLAEPMVESAAAPARIVEFSSVGLAGPALTTVHSDDVNLAQDNLYEVWVTVDDTEHANVQRLWIQITNDLTETAYIYEWGELEIATDLGVLIQGASPGEQFGTSVSTAGDVNGDGLADLIIGAPAQGAGHVYVLFGADDLQNLDLSGLMPEQGFVLTGLGQGDQTGWSVASAGDMNGDGLDDLVFSAPRSDSEQPDSGTVYLIFGQTDLAELDLETLSPSQGIRIQGASAFDVAGVAIASAGDVNGDGFEDLIIGAPYSQNTQTWAGESYLIYGGPDLSSLDLSALNSSQGFRLTGSEFGARSGFSVASAGDVNGDGLDDLIVGAFGATGADYYAGASYIIYGSQNSQDVSLATLTPEQGFAILGASFGEISGWSVDGAGDVNGDGFDDVIIGAPWGSMGGFYAGQAYVIYGGQDAETVDLSALSPQQGFIIQGDEAFDDAGRSVSSAGDVNGDGYSDLLIGAPFATSEAGPHGEAYIIYGGQDLSQDNQIDLTTLTEAQGLIIRGDAAFDVAGWAVSAAGDVNGDGFDDVSVGAPSSDDGGVDAGDVFIIFGGATGTEVTENSIHQGSMAVDQFTGGAGADTFLNISTGDVVRGGAGNDFVYLDTVEFVDLDGGHGLDSLVLNGSDWILNLTVETFSQTRLTDFERIDLTGQGTNTLFIDVLGVLNLTGADAVDNGVTRLIIDGNGDDTVYFEAHAWTLTANVDDYHQYTHISGHAELSIHNEVQVSSMPGGLFGSISETAPTPQSHAPVSPYLVFDPLSYDPALLSDYFLTETLIA